jgi:hypothetical protein
MKLVKESRLIFGAGGKAPKVYEVEMAEVGPDRFIVNFRYGKQGDPLKSGTKTTFPVNGAEAERVFAQLIGSKREAGYEDEAAITTPPASLALTSLATAPVPAASATAPVPAASARPVASPPPLPSSRTTPLPAAQPEADAILRCIQGQPVTRIGARSRRPWKPDRAIWRAGELRLRQAEPVLLSLLNQDLTQPLRAYSIAWALGRCGSAASISALQQRLVLNAKQPEYVQHMAQEAIRALSDDVGRQALIQARAQALSPAVKKAYIAQQSAEVAAALTRGMQNKRGAERNAALQDLASLYFIDDATARPALLSILQQHPISELGDTFRVIRRIFKVAEFRCDGQVFGLIAHRVSKTPPRARRRWNPKPTIPFQKGTRAHLIRRAWRVLRKLAQDGDAKRYVQMAVGLLLPFTDADAGTPQVVTLPARFRWAWVDVTQGRGRNTQRRRQRTETRAARRITIPTFGSFWALNFILRAHHPNLQSDRMALRWYGDPKPLPASARPEAFRECWDTFPQGLLHLLIDSRCQPVHHFAATALAQLPAFTSRLRILDLIPLLRSPYEVTAELAISLIRPLYNNFSPNLDLVSAALHSVSAAARATAYGWIDTNPSPFLQSAPLILDALLSRHADTRAHMHATLRRHPLLPDTAQDLVQRCTHTLLQSQDDAQTSLIADVLTQTLRAHLHLLGFERAMTLLDHHLPAVRDLALALIQDTLRQHPHRVTPQLLLALALSPAQQNRAVAAKVILERPNLADDALLQALTTSPHADNHALCRLLLLSRPHSDLSAWLPIFAFSAHASLRAEAPALLLHTLSAHPQSPSLLPFFLSAIDRLRAQAPTPSPPDIPPLQPPALDLLALLSLSPCLDLITRAPFTLTAAPLIHSPHPALHAFAAQILNALPAPPQDLALLLTLSAHESASLRAISHHLITHALHLVRADLSLSIRLLDSAWPDTRAFAQHLFLHLLDPHTFPPDIIIAICDSPLPDAQRFGISLLSRTFQEAHGPLYLMRLAQHPSPDLQSLVTSLLDRFAAGSPDRLVALQPFFLSVLSRVNKNRVNKQRALAFLRAHSATSPEVASAIAQTLSALAPTAATETRSACVEILLSIRQRFPLLPNPLTLLPPKAHHAR